MLLLAAAFATMWGCEKMSLVSPTGSTITLTINKTSVPINGTAEVTASVIESAGTPVQNGTVVSFTSSFGIIEPREARTQGGVARVTFMGTQSGTAKIGAFSGGAKTAADLEVKVGAAGAETLRVRAEPSNVPQNGGTSQIVVTVHDASGGPLANAPVLFTTDTGTVNPGAATTDANGEARTTLTTNRTAKVTATVGSKTGDVTVSVVTAPTVTITSSPNNPTAGNPVAFTITPSAASSANPISTLVVDFGDGQTQTLQGVTGPVGLTHTYNREGGYTVNATATDINGQRGVSSHPVIVAAADIPTVTMTVAQNPVPPASQGLATFTVTANGSAGRQIRSVVVRLSDGTVIYSGTSGASFAYKFGGGGTYGVTATATDSQGGTAVTSTTVVVQPY